MAKKCCCTECCVKLQELEERLEKLELERDTAIQEKEELVTENEELESKVRNLNKRVADLEKEVAEQKKHIQQSHVKETQMTQELKSQMTQELKSLKERVAVLEKGSATLYVAQAASLFQQSLCCALLPDTFEGDPSATIKELVNYLKGKKELPEDTRDDLGVARNKWKDIRKKLGWTQWNDDVWQYKRLPDDLKAIISLKKGRVSSAHPPTIELKEAMKYVPQIEVEEPVRKHIRDFIGSMEGKMRRCGLSHEGIEEFRHSGSNEDILQLDTDLQ